MIYGKARISSILYSAPAFSAVRFYILVRQKLTSYQANERELNMEEKCGRCAVCLKIVYLFRRIIDARCKRTCGSK